MHDQDQRVAGRLCAVRKSEQAIASAQRKLDQREHKHQIRVRPETREYAHYVMVFTTLPEWEMGAGEVLEYYRFRWQIELVFKRLKSILAVGHLPKRHEESSRAWLYGKLCVALLTQKLVHLGSSISPWGYDLGSVTEVQSMA
jgi:IS4 transposase